MKGAEISRERVVDEPPRRRKAPAEDKDAINKS
jgi:hypothetical protein